MREIGINLYSCRGKCQTEADFRSTLSRLKEDGYSFVQVSAVPLPADVIRRATEEAGLPVRLTHVPYDRLMHDLDRVMEEHAALSCRNIGLGMMPEASLREESACRAEIERLEKLAETLESNGFRFFYHHHFMEFYRYGGRTIFDMLIDDAPHVHFTADTYWLQYGGVDVCAFLRRLRGRIECVHLKDYRIDLDGRMENAFAAFAPAMCPVGDGTLNFHAIAQTMRDSGTMYYFVEQDNADSHPDTFGQLARSAAWLRREIDLY